MRTGAVAVVAAALVASGCARRDAPSGGPAGPREGGIITVALAEEPTHLGGVVVGAERMAARAVSGQMRWGLLGVSDDYSYEPRLAESVPTETNGLVKRKPFTVTFKIRKDAVWSDGTPITAKDVMFTWRTIMAPKTRAIWRRGYDLIAGIDSPDPKTVVIRFKKPFAGYLDLFSPSSYGQVLPAHLLSGKDINSAEASGPLVASGPFVLEKWDAGSSIVLARNPRFFGRRAWADRLVFKVTRGESAARDLLEMGGVDVYAPEMDEGVLDGGLLDRLARIPDATVATTPSAVYEQLWFNVASGPFADRAARIAVASALDVSAIASQALGPAGRPAWSVAPRPDGPRQPPTATWGRYAAGGGSAASSAAAKPRGKRFRVVAPRPGTPAGVAGRRRLLEAIERQLRDAGVSVEATMVAGADLFASRLPAGRFEMAAWGMLWQATPDLVHFYAANRIPPAGQNFAGYENARVSQLVRTLEAETDTILRARAMDELDRHLARDLPVLPLVHRATVVVTRSNIHPSPPNPSIDGPFGDMARWWVGT